MGFRQRRDSHFLENEPYHHFFSRCHTKLTRTERKGEPPREYGVPDGWVRFPIRPPPARPKTKRSEDATSGWHRAYHGTKVGMVRRLLDNGELVPMGQYPPSNKNTFFCFPDLRRSDLTRTALFVKMALQRFERHQ